MNELLAGTINDVVADFLYYDRRGDEELKRGDIEGMIERGETSADEIVATFKSCLEAGLES